MANQAYVVAYVTGLVHLALAHLSTCSIAPLPTAVCATTLLYDYALTFGEEVRPDSLRSSPSRLTTFIHFRRSQECGRQLPSLSITRPILTPHSLRLSIPKFLFIVNRYVVIPMLVCVCGCSLHLSTPIIPPQLQRDWQVYRQRTSNLPLILIPPPASSRTHLPQDVRPCINLIHSPCSMLPLVVSTFKPFVLNSSRFSPIAVSFICVGWSCE